MPPSACTRLRSFELRRETVQLRRFERASLLTPGAHRVHSDDGEAFGGVHGLCRSEDTLPRRPSLREARREHVRDVVVSGNCEQRKTEALEHLARTLELRRATAMCESPVTTRISGSRSGINSRSRSSGCGAVA